MFTIRVHAGVFVCMHLYWNGDVSLCLWPAAPLAVLNMAGSELIHLARLWAELQPAGPLTCRSIRAVSRGSTETWRLHRRASRLNRSIVWNVVKAVRGAGTLYKGSPAESSVPPADVHQQRGSWWDGEIPDGVPASIFPPTGIPQWLISLGAWLVPSQGVHHAL